MWDPIYPAPPVTRIFRVLTSSIVVAWRRDANQRRVIVIRTGREKEVKLLPIAAALAMLGGTALPGQDLPQWVLELSRIKRQAKAELIRLPNFACVESINRFERAPGSEVFKPADTIRLEVAFVEGKELFAPVGGAGGFQEPQLSELARGARGGALSTGAF